MAQTALQELIEFIHDNPNCGEVEILFKAQSLLPKERQDLIDAYLINPNDTVWGNIGSDYFTQNFNPIN